MQTRVMTRDEKRTEIADGVLVQQTLAGDQKAFEILVHRYSTPLFNFIYHFLGNYDQACDVLQQVFLQLYLSLSTLRTGEPLKAWLFQVARHRCVDEVRRMNRKGATHFSELESANEEDELPSFLNLPDPGPLPEELTEQHELQEELRRAIQALPPKYRLVILLRYIAQLHFSEIGRTLHIPEATAKTYYQRAKPLLRASLQRYYQEGSA